MNKSLCKGAIQALVCVAFAVFSGAALSTPILVGTTVNATGIDGLDIDGMTYDVTFSTVPTPSPFTAGTQQSQDAASSLASALTGLSVVEVDGFFAPLGGSLSVMVDGNTSGDAAVYAPPSTLWISGSTNVNVKLLWGQNGFCVSPTKCDVNSVVAANFVAVPVPIVGAGFPGLVLVGGFLAWWRRKRKAAPLAA
jgi:hypothetical protein